MIEKRFPIDTSFLKAPVIGLKFDEMRSLWKRGTCHGNRLRKSTPATVVRLLGYDGRHVGQDPEREASLVGLILNEQISRQHELPYAEECWASDP